MKYNVLEIIKLKTSKGCHELLPGQVAALSDKIATQLVGEGRIKLYETISKACSDTTETEAPPTVTTTCSKCSFRAIPYINSSGKYIVDKCNVHGERLKVTHAEISAWSRGKRKKMSYIT